MATAGDVRRIALGMKNAIEGAHMGHPDFRVGGRIFASLHADARHAMVKLTPEQQDAFMREYPRVFEPESGSWGRQGYTRVTLDAADDDTLGEAITLAWQNTVRTAAPRRRAPARQRRPERR